MEFKLHVNASKAFHVDSLPQGCFQGDIPAEMVRWPSFPL